MPDAPPDACLTVVLPARDEEAAIEDVLTSILRRAAVLEVVVVDDRSDDATPDLVAKLAVEEPRIVLVRHARRLGRGAAARRGLAEATGRYVALHDVGGPGRGAPDYDALVEPLAAGRAEVVVAEADGRRVHAFRGDVARSIELHEDGRGHEAEVAAAIARSGWRVEAVAVGADGRRVPGVPVAPAGAHRGWWRRARRRPVRPAREHQPQAFDEADDELAQVLDTLEGAGNYADWIVRLCAPYLGDRALEVGAGHGTLVSRLAAHAHVTASDASPRCVEAMSRAFAGDRRISVRAFDLLADEPTGAYDSVVLANVLEHLGDDVLALRRVREQLVPGGSALVFVPAFDALYSGFDHKIGHYRRYQRRQLAAVAREAGLVVGELRYVNPVGAVGWLVTVRGLGRFPHPAAVGAFDRYVVPRLEALERRWRPPFGQSLFLAAHRPLNDAD